MYFQTMQSEEKTFCQKLRVKFTKWVSTPCGVLTLTSVCVIAVAMICAMVPSSYYALEYDDYGLHRDKLYNKVDYNRVYDNGYYFLGLNQEFIKFPRTYLYEQFSADLNSTLPVFSADGLEFGFQCTYQWRINKEFIPEIHRNFRLAYRQQVNNRVISAIKNVAISFTTEEFVTKRALVDDVITVAIGRAVASLGFEIPDDKFQFAKPILPDNIRVKSLQKVVQLINNDVQTLVQQWQLVLQETGVQTNLILSNATKVVNQAYSTNSRIIAEANAQAFNIVNSAEQTGLELLFKGMNITDTETMALLRQVIAIEGNPTASIYFGVNPSSVLRI